MIKKDSGQEPENLIGWGKITQKEEMLLLLFWKGERSAQEIIEAVRQKLGITLESNTAYPPLNKLTRLGYLKKRMDGWYSFYKLTNKGRSYINQKISLLESLKK